VVIALLKNGAFTSKRLKTKNKQHYMKELLQTFQLKEQRHTMLSRGKMTEKPYTAKTFE